MSEQKDVSKEPVTVDDLDRIFIRAQDDDSAAWKTVSAREATDLQFDTWAKSRMQIQGDDLPWTLEERADFCNGLWQAGALHMLKKDVDFEEGQQDDTTA